MPSSGMIIVKINQLIQRASDLYKLFIQTRLIAAIAIWPG